ncbi:MAG: GYD domain-containing protein [Vulcanimicrobiaceae bacterium]
MPKYLFQWVYKDTSIKAMVDTSVKATVDSSYDRYAQLKMAVEGFGGELEEFFYAFGKWDGFAVVEFPDAERCAACSLTLAGSGTNAAFKTTVLIAPDEAIRAMRRAAEAKTGYRSPETENSLRDSGDSLDSTPMGS